MNRKKPVTVDNLKIGDIVQWQEHPHKVVNKEQSLDGLFVSLRLLKCEGETYREDRDAWPFNTRRISSNTVVDLLRRSR